MRLSRNATLVVQFLLDECLPPILRDSRWFMWLPFRLVFGSKSDVFFRFKREAQGLTKQQIRDLYAETSDVHIDRETDLNRGCIDRILELTKGPRVLDIACGRGYLAGLLAQQGLETFGTDILIAASTRQRYPEVAFLVASLEALPHPDKAFDTVICAHTLEHIQSLQPAIAELRRVAAKRLIVVVPKQRNYLYTFDLHLHFFPYPHDLLKLMGSENTNVSCIQLEGDLLYVEDLEA